MFSNLLSKENILLWSFMANLANQRLACSLSTYYIVVNKYMNFSIKGLYASALITWNLTCSFITWIGNFSENRKREPIYIYIYMRHYIWDEWIQLGHVYHNENIGGRGNGKKIIQLYFQALSSPLFLSCSSFLFLFLLL